MQSPRDECDLASLHKPCFPDRSVGKESACNAGDPGSIPGLGRSPGEEICQKIESHFCLPVGQDFF